MRAVIASFIAIAALATTGCVQTSDLYAVRQWEDPRPAEPDDRPRVNPDQLEAKRSFAAFVASECNKESLGDIPDPNTDKSADWAKRFPAASACVKRIAAYAADQCILISRRQNVVAADANLLLGAVTLSSGLAAVSYAISGTADDRLAAASLAGATGASNNTRGFLPANASTKITDLLGVSSIYADSIGLTDGDVKNATAYDADKAHTAFLIEYLRSLKKPLPGWALAFTDATLTDWKRGDGEMVKLARVHDAVFAGCTSNAYGIRPARKPIH